MMAKAIEPCDDPRGHFWRSVDGKTSQCSRCGECARRDDFAASKAQEESTTAALSANEVSRG